MSDREQLWQELDLNDMKTSETSNTVENADKQVTQIMARMT